MQGRSAETSHSEPDRVLSKRSPQATEMLQGGAEKTFPVRETLLLFLTVRERGVSSEVRIYTVPAGGGAGEICLATYIRMSAVGEKGGSSQSPAQPLDSMRMNRIEN